MNNPLENRSKWIALAVTASMMLGGSGYLYYDNNQIKELNESQKVELNVLSEAKSNLQNEVALMQEQLEHYKGKNRELDNMVTSAAKEIAEKEHKIKKLIASNASLKKIQSEFYTLRKTNEKNIKRMKELEEKLSALSLENQSLRSDNAELKEKLSELEERNLYLERKVSVASALKVENASVLGEKKAKNGSYAKTNLKKADRFLVTFDVLENKVTEPGEKIIYIRVVDPQGNLVKNYESGNFTNADENMEMSYTQKLLVDYGNAKQTINVPVMLNGQQHAKGNYQIEFYCEGNFCGIKKVKLK